MSSMPNGRKHDPLARRVKLGELDSYPSRPRATPARGNTPFHSGRRFVLLAGLVILSVWAGLYLGFRDWRARYRTRARYGATQVVPVIDAFAETVPPGVKPDEWREAVKQTHDMLMSVTGSNLLDLSQLHSLRGELEQAVERARAHPDSAVGELAAVWDIVADRAEFVLWDSRSATGERHPRPRILPTRPAWGKTPVSRSDKGTLTPTRP
jgi:hypothetical protein